MKREICAIVTKGTLTEGELLSANPDALYLMAITESNRTLASQNAERIFGVCVIDVATSRIILGQVRVFIFNIRPLIILLPFPFFQL